MKPNITFIQEKGQWWIYYPLHPRIPGGENLVDTFAIAFKKANLSMGEKVEIRYENGDMERIAFCS